MERGMKVGRSRLDPLPGRPADRPKPSSTEASVRMLDIQMVWDVAVATGSQPRGARRRAAEKHGVAPATITEAVRRVEDAFGVKLFNGEAGLHAEPLTVSGRAFVEHGALFLKTFQIFRKMLQQAEDAS